MDDFSVIGGSFERCLKNLELVLQKCQEKNLVLNWEKCHFMDQVCIVLGHRISSEGREVDYAKISTIQTLMLPTTVEGVTSFLGHAGLYKRVIKDFSKIARPMCRFLEKNAIFYFDEACMKAFDELESRLV